MKQKRLGFGVFFSKHNKYFQTKFQESNLLCMAFYITLTRVPRVRSTKSHCNINLPYVIYFLFFIVHVNILHYERKHQTKF